MDFFGSLWQSIIKDLLWSLFPEKRLELSLSEVSRVTISANYPSEVVVTLVTPGLTTPEQVLIMHVDLEKFWSGWNSRMLDALAVRQYLKTPPKDLTQDK